MKQVNMTIADEDFTVLVIEAAKRQLESGNIIRVSSLAYDLLKPTIANLNGTPIKAPQQDSNSVDKQDNEPVSGHPLANIDL